MSQKSLKVTLLGRTFTVSCPAGEEADMETAASMLQERLDNMRKRTFAGNHEHLALMVALNLCHDLLLEQRQNRAYSEVAEQRMKILEDTVRKALEEQASKLDRDDE